MKLRHGDLEVRLTGEPFPLYPGERLQEIVTKLKAVPRDSALRLQAVMDFKDGEVERLALDQWLFEGPGTFLKVEICFLLFRFSERLGSKQFNTSLRFFQYPIFPGTYIPRVEVEIIETIVATIIPHTPHTALKIRANQDCKVFYLPSCNLSYIFNSQSNLTNCYFTEICRLPGLMFSRVIRLFTTG